MLKNRYLDSYETINFKSSSDTVPDNSYYPEKRYDKCGRYPLYA